MKWKDELTVWVMTAPPAMILAVNIVLFSTLAGWAYAIEKDQARQSTLVAVAAEQAKTAADQARAAAEVARNAEHKLDKVDEKIDALLETILVIRGEDRAYKAILARELASKEKK